MTMMSNRAMSNRAMSNRAWNRPARLNRVLLALTGLVLLAVSAFTLVLAFGPLERMLPFLSSRAPLIWPGTPMPFWLPYTTIAVTLLVGFGCLRWLLAQTRHTPPSRTWRLITDAARGVTYLDTTHAATAIAEDVQTYRGVAKASATLTGPRAQPRLRLNVHTETGTAINPLRLRITEHALPRLRQALELQDLPTELLLRLDTVQAGRTR